ncbi:hypothetical protein MYMA111404_02195 [Mycoplasma marinum]|uniref:Uncharacterized protein n=1 Tax=Mycoplasma marinum TaxID=1937190 RepID=A0A4R0XR33_9MOLU|nr:hypothetical protein [Mycoplasma marinum]TCG11345.1 hypothetical protein C4B24_02220 [Mycoplasma marinum]
MHRNILIIVALVVVFAITFLVTISARRKRNKLLQNPLFDTLRKYQDEILDKGYDISITNKPTNQKNDEKLLYQALGKISNVDFNLKEPEGELKSCNMWISEDRLIINNDQENTAFKLKRVVEFEFDLDETSSDFLFSYNDEYFRVTTKDLYFVALLDLLVAKFKQDKEKK